MTLHLHRAPRTDLLADELGDLLARPLEDPFATELVLVPARGVERWLSQRLSHRLGRGRRRGARRRLRRGGLPLAAVAGRRAHRHRPRRPVGARRARLAAARGDRREPRRAWNGTLARHLGHFDTGDEAEFRRGRRYAVARRIAALFASYAVQRPQLLVDWLDGRPTDGHGGRSTTTWPGSRGSGRRSWPGSVRRRRTSGTPRRSPGCAPGCPTCPRGSRCSATPGCPSPRSSCSLRWPPPTTSTCGCRTPAT